MRASPILVITAVSLLAGCLSQTAPTPSGVLSNAAHLVPIPAFPIEVDHDHSKPAEHALSANLDRLAYNSGYRDGAVSAIPKGQGFSELFVRDDLAFLGRRGGDDGGFVIFDIKDPIHPKRLGDYQGLANYDMESTYDNHYVFFVSQYLNTQQGSSLPPRAPGDLPRGIHIVDISDPAHPAEAGYVPVPTRGSHTLTYYRTETGRELVAAQTYDFLPDPSLGSVPGFNALPIPPLGVNVLAQRVLLLEFVRAPQPHLELLSTFEKDVLQPFPNEFFPHDVAIQKHPKTGQLIMYVGYWDLGAYLVDISDPKTPRELSRLSDFSPSKLAQVHLAAPADTLIDGHHVTVTEPELGGATPETGQFTLFDTTDPAHPTRLGYWTLPGNLHNDVGLRFSPHNFEVEDGRLYLAHYHAGVWIVDVHNHTRLLEPEALAFVQPNEVRPDYAGDIPNVWTALYDRGYVYASDMATGLHVFRYAGDA